MLLRRQRLPRRVTSHLHPEPVMPMKKLGLILQLSTLAVLTVIAISGCSEDDPKPEITRLTASQTCGVVPMRVDFRADASGGTPMADPTGGNNWLRMTWDFGDGTVISDGTSIAYHQYEEPGQYTVTITAEDDNGDKASRSLEIIATADSLGLRSFTVVDADTTSEVIACQPMEFGIRGYLCGFDPEEDSYERFIFRWEIGDSIYDGTNPRHSFAPADVGENVVVLHLEDPTRALSRVDTIQVEVLSSNGSDLWIENDWLLSPQGAAQDTLFRDIVEFPDALVYTTTLHNDGPDEAYAISITGDFPSNNRIVFDRTEASNGAAVWYPGEREWVWFVEYLAPGETATLNAYFDLEIADARSNHAFDTVMSDYACDISADNDSLRAVLNIVSAPADVMLFSHWNNNSSQPVFADSLLRDVTSFPDTLVVTVAVFNSGPSAAFDLVVDGDLPADPRIQFVTQSVADSVFTYDEVTKHYTWDILRVNRDGFSSCNLTFLVADGDVGDTYFFDALMAEYPDDPNPGDHEVRATLILNSVP
jgi:PKD repeat protein